MKRMRQKIIAIVTALVCSVGCIFSLPVIRSNKVSAEETTATATADDIISSGKCGENVTWKLDDKGVLTISGEGDMYDYEEPAALPWYHNDYYSVVIEKGVTSIGAYAFSDSYSIKYMTIKNPDCTIYDSADTINGYSFIRGYEGSKAQAYAEKYGIEYVVIFTKISSECGENVAWELDLTELPGKLTISGNGDMHDSGELLSWHYHDIVNEIIIEDGVTSIRDYAFDSLINLTSVTIPNSVTRIGEGAFIDCYNLQSLVIPNGVKSIGNMAFIGCEELKDITLPTSIEEIGFGCFLGVNKLENIFVSEENTHYSSIDGILYNDSCTELIFYPEAKGYNKFIVPDSVKSIETCAFSDVEDLTEIILPEGLETIGKMAFENTNIESLEIPNTVYEIGGGAFFGSMLKSISIPEGVISLKGVNFDLEFPYYGTGSMGMFEYCRALETIELPESLTELGSLSFYGCESLTDIYYNAKEEKWSLIEVSDDFNQFENYKIGSNVMDVLPDSPNAKLHFQEDPIITTTTTTTTETTTTETTTITTTTTTAATSATTTMVTDYNAEPFEWNRDNWNFINSSQYFTHSDYYVNQEHWSALRSNLSNIEWDYAKKWKNEWWGGSCYGMSALVILANAGLFPYSDYTADADCLYEMGTPAQNYDTESIINYYQMLQVKDVIQQKYRTIPQRSNQTNIEEIISFLDENGPVLVGFKKNGWGGHAVIAYDVNYGSWTWDGVNYQGCIELCDPNHSYSFSDECCIYFNTSTYNWTIPYYSYAGVSSVNGAVFNYVGNNIAEINESGFYSNASAITSSDYIARLDAMTIAQNHSVQKVMRTGGQFFNQNTAAGEIVSDTFYYAGGESEGVFGYLLKDAQAGYRISQNTALPMSLSLEYENCMLEADSAAGTEIIFDEKGYVSVTGEAADYSIRMIYNEGCYITDWYGIEISGTGSDVAVLEQTEDGYILSSDNLSDVAVVTFNDDYIANAAISTDYTKLLIYEIDEQTIGIAVDADGNGTYETMLQTNPVKEITTGDVDGNGIVDISDATAAMTMYARNAAGLSVDEYTEDQKQAADVDKDGDIDISDATAILTYYAQNAAGLNLTWDKILA